RLTGKRREGGCECHQNEQRPPPVHAFHCAGTGRAAFTPLGVSSPARSGPNQVVLPTTVGDTGHGDPSGPHRPRPVAPGVGTEKHGRLGRSGSEWRDRPDRWAKALRTGEHSMRTVLGKAAGRATLILVSAGMVGS